MKKSIPGILCLLAMPCCVLLFVKVESLTGSDLVALLAALLFYVAVIVFCTLVFNHQDPRNMKMEHPIIKEDETPADDAAGSPKEENCADAKEEK